MGGPSAGPCARYLLGGATVGAGLGVASGSNRDDRVERGAAGALLGATAGYAVCVQVWRQTQELETQMTALESSNSTAASAGSREGAQGDRILQSIRVVDNRAITLELNLQFATAQSQVPARSQPHLHVLANSLRANPNSRALIVGHTDNVGESSRNRTLARQRAAAVAAFLIDQGVSRDRLLVQGVGSDRPAASNDTPGGRARNRRVEITIVPTATA